MSGLLGLVATVALLAGLRWAIHRSLAPERVIESRTPAAVGLRHQDVRLPTENGKSLFGWYIPASRDGAAGKSPAVVLLHGWGGNAETLLPLTRPLHEAGFALLFVSLVLLRTRTEIRARRLRALEALEAGGLRA